MAAASKASKRPPWLVLAICVPGALLLGAAMYGYFVGFEVALRPSDRGALVTFEGLGPLPADIKKRPEAEQLHRRVHTDLSKSLEYEYDGSEDTSGALYLSCSIIESRSRKDAMGEYLGRTFATPLGALLAGEKLEEVARDDLLKWGDESRSVLLTMGGSSVGNYFLARKGTRVFVLIVSGVYYDKPDSLRALVLPHLERMDRDGI